MGLFVQVEALQGRLALHKRVGECLGTREGDTVAKENALQGGALAPTVPSTCSAAPTSVVCLPSKVSTPRSPVKGQGTNEDRHTLRTDAVREEV